MFCPFTCLIVENLIFPWDFPPLRCLKSPWGGCVGLWIGPVMPSLKTWPHLCSYPAAYSGEQPSSQLKVKGIVFSRKGPSAKMPVSGSPPLLMDTLSWVGWKLRVSVVLIIGFVLWWGWLCWNGSCLDQEKWIHRWGLSWAHILDIYPLE